MNTSNRFWKLITALLVIALFYVGHGLHAGGSMLPTAEAQSRQELLDAIEKAYEQKGDGRGGFVFTCNSAGTTVHVWALSSEGRPHYLWSRSVADRTVNARRLLSD